MRWFLVLAPSLITISFFYLWKGLKNNCLACLIRMQQELTEITYRKKKKKTLVNKIWYKLQESDINGVPKMIIWLIFTYIGSWWVLINLSFNHITIKYIDRPGFPEIIWSRYFKIWTIQSPRKQSANSRLASAEDVLDEWIGIFHF